MRKKQDKIASYQRFKNHLDILKKQKQKRAMEVSFQHKAWY